MRLITIDGTVTRVESVENPSLSLHEVWPMVLRLPEVVGVEIIEQDRKGFQLRVVSAETMHPPKKVGDISHAGIFLSRVPEVIPFVKRLECNNGLMDYRRGKKVSVADKSKRRAEFLQHYEECLQEIYTCSKQTLEDFIRSVEEPLVNPSAYLSRIMREARIPATHQVALNEMLPQLLTTTNWFELANLVTSYAHNFSDPQEWQRFEALGGLVLEYSREADCSQCGRRASGTPVHAHVH